MTTLPVTDYPSLQDAILRYLGRDELGPYVALFIAQAEARIYRDLRVAAMEKALSLTIAAPAAQPTDNAAAYGTAAVPADYLAMREVYLCDSNGNVQQQLERTTPFYIHQKFNAYVAVGTPAYFAREGTNFIFAPVNGPANAAGIYWARLPALSDANPSNWLTASNPDLIVAAAMIEACTYIADTDALQYWDAQYPQLIGRVQAVDDAERMSGSPPVMRRG